MLAPFIPKQIITKWENHRTDTQFEDSLIAKTFIFQYVFYCGTYTVSYILIGRKAAS